MKLPDRSMLAVLLWILALPLVAQEPFRAKAVETYGTSATSYVQIPAAAFGPSASFDHHQLLGVYATNCIGGCFLAPLQLPSGAKIISLRLSFVDQDPTRGALLSLKDCDATGQSCMNHPNTGAGPADCVFAGGVCSGLANAAGPGSVTGDVTPDNVTVDNANRLYYLIGGACCDSTVRIAGATVGYVLQVSPSPAIADFDDVPTSHPYFQYIEALKHAGITGGCIANPPQFCPDRPITRGEMAVFLSLALGLHFQ